MQKEAPSKHLICQFPGCNKRAREGHVHPNGMAKRRLTQELLNAAMKRIERNPDNAALEAGAALLGAGFEVDVDGGLLYRGSYWPNRVELADKISCELGQKRNGLYQRAEPTQADDDPSSWLREEPLEACPWSAD